MRMYFCMLAVLILAGNLGLAAEPEPIVLAKRVITRENQRLTKAVERMKKLMEKGTLSYAYGRELSHAVQRLESTVACNKIILRGDQADLIITAAQMIVHGDLERHYSEWRQKPDTPIKELSKQEQSFLNELKVLKGWQNITMDRDNE